MALTYFFGWTVHFSPWRSFIIQQHNTVLQKEKSERNNFEMITPNFKT